MDDRTLPPNVCDVVQYSDEDSYGIPDLYRVTGWLKPRPARCTGYDMAISGAIVNELTAEQAFEAFLFNVVIPNVPRSIPLVWCGREEATHLALYSSQPIVVPVEQCTVIGKVAWSEQTLEKAIAYAYELAAKDVPSGAFV